MVLHRVLACALLLVGAVLLAVAGLCAVYLVFLLWRDPSHPPADTDGLGLMIGLVGGMMLPSVGGLFLYLGRRLPGTPRALRPRE
jgi:hypothetical protein